METVIDTIRRFSVTGASLSPERTLGQTAAVSSLGLSLLRSALVRQRGNGVPILKASMTIGELCIALGEGASPGPATASPSIPVNAPAAAPVIAPPAKSASGNVGGGLWGARPLATTPVWAGHGIDLEELTDFPAWPAVDADQKAFFETHFTASELAHAAGRPQPHAHLCGLWCAKEAVRKAIPSAARAGWLEIEITHGVDGNPVVRFAGAEGLGLALSISHSSRQATASVIAWRL